MATSTAAATFMADKPCRRGHWPCERYVSSTKACVKCKALAAADRNARGDRRGEHIRQRRMDPERFDATTLNARLRRKFGITLLDYNRMLAAQGGVCAICRQACRTGHRLSVDHDHATGEVRGLLCRCCNAALGHMNDDPELLRAAASYCETARMLSRANTLPTPSGVSGVQA